MHPTIMGSVLAALTLSSLLVPTTAQTYSSCNPLQQSGCPADPALGTSVDVDFTSDSSNEYTASGAVSYTSDGAAFTISQHGDAPTLSSNWYIMFGHVDYVVKAAPGTGIVSAAILQSDCLDEIDWEWLGGDDTQAQSNYFGKGITTTGYNRGAYHGAPNNHDEFHTYSIDWTADQIVWSIDGTTVRAMTQQQAEAGQYPQTPMYVKLGAWAGGDPSNPQGTIQWAGGITDYSQGPFTMYVKSVHVTDYSTGSQYSYSGTSGTWQSIVSNGGQINGEGNGTPSSSGTAPAVTSSVPNAAPLAFGNGGDSSSVTATRTGWPWSGTATATVVTVSTSTSPSPSSYSSAVSSSALASASLEVVTSYNQQGFPTLVTIDPAAATAAKCYDEQGFLTSCTTSVPSSTNQPGTTQSSTETTLTGSASVIPGTLAPSSSVAGQSTSQSPVPTASAAIEESSTAAVSSSNTVGISASTSPSATTTNTVSTPSETAAASTSTETQSAITATSSISSGSNIGSPTSSNFQSETTLPTSTSIITGGTQSSSSTSTTTSSGSGSSASSSISSQSSTTPNASTSTVSTNFPTTGSTTAARTRGTTSASVSRQSTTFSTSSHASNRVSTTSTTATASGTPPAVNGAVSFRIFRPFGVILAIVALRLF